MKVYVVMGNDYPDCVFSTEKKAEAYCDKRRAEKSGVHQPRVYWRAYEFIVDEKKP
jgi:hypothetical protein